MLKVFVIFLIISYFSPSYQQVSITPAVIRTQPALGGKTPVNINDPLVIEAAQFAVQSTFGFLGYYKIKTAYKQIVSGTMFYLDIYSYGYDCTFQVWSKPWIRWKQVMKVNCA
jgi:hypothetical protein